MSSVHLTLSVVWGVLLVPTLLWWRDSVLWVAVMSLYANLVGHWSAYQAARAEEKVDDNHTPDSQLPVLPPLTVFDPSKPSRSSPPNHPPLRPFPEHPSDNW